MFWIHLSSAAIFGPLADSATSSTDSATRNWRYQVAHRDHHGQRDDHYDYREGFGDGGARTSPAPASGLPLPLRTPAPSRAITWGGGNNGTTVAAGTSVTSDPITY